MKQMVYQMKFLKKIIHAQSGDDSNKRIYTLKFSLIQLIVFTLQRHNGKNILLVNSKLSIPWSNNVVPLSVIPTKNHEDYGYEPFNRFTTWAIEKLHTRLSVSFEYIINLCPSILITYFITIEYLILFNLIISESKINFQVYCQLLTYFPETVTIKVIFYAPTRNKKFEIIVPSLIESFGHI